MEGGDGGGGGGGSLQAELGIKTDAGKIRCCTPGQILEGSGRPPHPTSWSCLSFCAFFSRLFPSPGLFSFCLFSRLVSPFPFNPIVQAIELDPSSYIYRSNRSACYALQGKHEKAKEEAEACIRINPDFIKGYYRWATPAGPWCWLLLRFVFVSLLRFLAFLFYPLLPFFFFGLLLTCLG